MSADPVLMSATNGDQAVTLDKLQMDRERPRVLVAGSSRPFDRVAIRQARLVSATLAEYGFDLVTGNAPGVDKAVAAAFCFEVKKAKQKVTSRYAQLSLPWWRRGTRWPFWPGYPGGLSRVKFRRFHEWLEEARSCADAAVIIGGHGGTLTIANRFIDAGKPVFPMPFSGGQSNAVFQEVLRNWCDNPVPGLSKTQFLRLAVPWVGGAGALGDLLLGTLSRVPEIFISYRRADSEWISGRLRSDLAERFGSKRVFMDVEHISAGQNWNDRINEAIANCRVAIVVASRDGITRKTSDGAVAARSDVFCEEISMLLRFKKPIVVVRTPETPPPDRWELPPEIADLAMIQALVISPIGWSAAVEEIVRTVRPWLRAGRPDTRIDG